MALANFKAHSLVFIEGFEARALNGSVMNEDLQEKINIENDRLEFVALDKSDFIDETIVKKKRGRKPKGGKIVQQVITNILQQEDKPNIILHLKCSMKDLQATTQNNSFVDSYNSLTCKNDSTYEIICNDNLNIFNEKHNTNISSLESDYDVDIDEDSICKDSNKEIWFKNKYI